MDGAVKLQLLFQTMGEANRLRIIKVIGEQERSVSEIVAAVKLSQPLISHHLRVLRENQILETKRKGPFVYYKLKNTKLLDCLSLFSEVFKEINPVDFKKPMFCCPPGKWRMSGREG